MFAINVMHTGDIHILNKDNAYHNVCTLISWQLIILLSSVYMHYRFTFKSGTGDRHQWIHSHVFTTHKTQMLLISHSHLKNPRKWQVNGKDQKGQVRTHSGLEHVIMNSLFSMPPRDTA